MAAAKKTNVKKSAAAAGAKKRSNRKPKRSWSVYVHRQLRQVNAKLSLSSRAMAIMNSFCSDIFERIATEAANLARINKKSTLGSREIQTAVRLSLPAELGKHAIAEGTKAMSRLGA